MDLLFQWFSCVEVRTSTTLNDVTCDGWSTVAWWCIPSQLAAFSGYIGWYWYSGCTGCSWGKIHCRFKELELKYLTCFYHQHLVMFCTCNSTELRNVKSYLQNSDLGTTLSDNSPGSPTPIAFSAEMRKLYEFPVNSLPERENERTVTFSFKR